MMKVFDKFKNYLQGFDQNFWIYNYIASFILYYFITKHVLTLLLFPVALVMVQFLLENYFKNAPDIQDYLGFYPFKKDIQWFIPAAIISLIVSEISVPIMVLGLLYIWWINKEKTV